MVGMASCWWCNSTVTEADIVREPAELGQGSIAYRTPAASPGLATDVAARVERGGYFQPVPQPAPGSTVQPAAAVPASAGTAPEHSFPEEAHERHGPSAAQTTAVLEPVAGDPSPPAPPPRSRRRGFSLWRTLWLGSVAAVLVALGLLAFSLAVPPPHLTPEPESTEFERVVFPDLGFAVEYPAGWHQRMDENGVSFLSDERGRDSTRGFSVSTNERPLATVEEQIRSMSPDITDAYDGLHVQNLRVENNEALRHIFVSRSLRYEQWWIDRGDHTLRLQMWSRPADDSALAVNERIVASLHLL